MPGQMSNQSMTKIHLGPYVNLQGRACEAMEFYQTVLGGNLHLQTLNDRGESKAAGPGDSIMHSRLEAGGSLIIASDGHPDYPAKVGENMAIALGGTDKDRFTKIFDDLAEGGKIKMPLMEQPWGVDVGRVTDRFSINWMVYIDKA